MNSESLKPIQRDIGADVLKSICCVCVIVIHTASLSISTLDVRSADWYSALFWGTLCRFAVPIFFMVTGALLFDPARELPIKRIYSRYFLRMLSCLLFWTFMYEAFSYLAGYILFGYYFPTWFTDTLNDVFGFDHHFHLYYLQIMLLFYVLLPIARGFVASASRSMLRYALLIWFVLGVLLPFLYTFEPFSSLSGIPAQYPISMTYAALGYGLSGYYLKTAKLERCHLKFFAAVFAVGFLGIYIPTVLKSHADGAVYLGLLEAFTPPAAMLTIGIYGLITILCKDKTEADMPLAVRLSKASFCVYLVHHFFVMSLRVLLDDAYCVLPALTIPVQTVLVFAASIAAYEVLKRIPIVNRYLI